MNNANCTTAFHHKVLNTRSIYCGKRLTAPAPSSREILRRKIRSEALSPDDIEKIVDHMVRGCYSQTELAVQKAKDALETGLLFKTLP
jgi:hypothetical protein